MFEKLGSFERSEDGLEPSDPMEMAPHQIPERDSGISSSPAPSSDGAERVLQALFSDLIRKVDRLDSTDLQRAFDAAHRKNIGPAAARRRANLPEGIDLLKGKATECSEEAMMSAIRRMMTDQKRDFSLQALPFLEPPVADPKDHILPEDHAGMAPRRSLAERAQSYIVTAFRKDFALAANVAFWGFLALFLFLDPQLSLVLFGNGVFFLLAICFVFMPETLTDLVMEAWKRFRGSDRSGKTCND